MSRETLVVTTALVLCASLAYADQKGAVPKSGKAMSKTFRMFTVGHAVSGIPLAVSTSKRSSRPVHNGTPNLANAIFSNYSKDANAQFISWYGYVVANYSSCISESHFHSCVHFAGNNAFAFTPAATVTSKKVTVPVFSFYPSALYEVDIYSSVGGLPGNVLAHSRKFTASDTSLCCTASRTVAMKANLVAGTQYFIGVACASNPCQGGWEMEDTDMSGAAVDYWQYQETYTRCTHAGFPTVACTTGSPWHASTYYPETGAVVIK